MNNRKHIKVDVRRQLWFESAGRCAICNEKVDEDPNSHYLANMADIAHIRDVNKKTHRYDPNFPKDKLNEADNLILVCKNCHQIIDNELEKTYSVEQLESFKKKQIDRIRLLTSICDNKRSIVLTYIAKIGQLIPMISWQEVANAMIPDRFPSSSQMVEISDSSGHLEDGTSDFYQNESNKICTVIRRDLLPRLRDKEASLVSVFALAPIPLLIKLGSLLSELIETEVYECHSDPIAIYQLHREPQRNWKWSDHAEKIQYKVYRPVKTHKSNKVVLNVSLSACITNDRITSVIGNKCDIWTITIDNPYVDYLKSQEQLSAFRELYRKLLNSLKKKYGQRATLHVFPAVPVSIAIEMGRCWLSKADLRLMIYDQNREQGNKFIPTLAIGENND